MEKLQLWLSLLLLGGIPTPLQNDGVRKLRSWNSQYIYIWKNKINVPNHQPNRVFQPFSILVLWQASIDIHTSPRHQPNTKIRAWSDVFSSASFGEMSSWCLRSARRLEGAKGWNAATSVKFGWFYSFAASWTSGLNKKAAHYSGFLALNSSVPIWSKLISSYGFLRYPDTSERISTAPGLNQWIIGWSHLWKMTHV